MHLFHQHITDGHSQTGPLLAFGFFSALLRKGVKYHFLKLLADSNACIGYILSLHGQHIVQHLFQTEGGVRHFKMS